jgi:protein O-GlcNAc transferase
MTDPRPADVTSSALSRLSELATAGRYPELEQSARELLQQWPDSGVVWKALAIALWMQNKDALPALERATTLLPQDPEVHSDRGNALLALRRPDEAVPWYRQAIALNREFKAAHHNLGLALSQIGHLAEAAASYRRALKLDPNFVEALTGLADVSRLSGESEHAVACYRRALALSPTLPQAHYGLGKAYQSLGQIGAAEASYRQALALNPHYVGAHVALGGLLYRMGDYRGAVAGFRRALSLDPASIAAGISAAVAEIAPVPTSAAEAAASCEAYAAALGDLETGLEERPGAQPSAFLGALRPFFLAYRHDDVCELMRSYGRIYATLMGKWQRDTGVVSDTRARSMPSKLRIGLVSEYFRNHSVYNAITHGWLRRLDRKRFSVDVFCLGARTDSQTKAAREMADHFEQGDRDLREWVRAIADRRPDVLIYPEVGMNPTTLQLASLRLARTQMVSWGHPVTSGLPTLDYFLSAAAFEPPDGAAHYTEQLVCLPNLGVCYERPEPPVATSETATPSDRGPVLICAGTPFKYSPEYDSVLPDIARRVGRCQFHFFNYEDGALSRRLLDRLHAAFAAAGLDGSAFLVLRPWAAPQQFEDFLGSADLLLDTIGFSGFNTVMQALARGLPVITVRGRTMRGRLGSGILERLSLNELVAADPASYVDIVASLLENRAGLSATRERIRAQLPRAYADQSVIDELQALLLRVG